MAEVLKGNENAFLSKVISSLDDYSQKIPKDILSCDKNDIKMLADREINTIVSTILSLTSNHSVLSEEGNPIKVTNSPTWIIDPLDGSYNLSRNIPIYCTSIALLKDYVPCLGLIYDLPNRKHYLSTDIRNSRYLGSDLSVSSEIRIENSVIASGFPLEVNFSPSQGNHFLNALRSFKKVRMFGSAAMSLLAVAKGNIDAYYEKDIYIWDIAAGCHLVERSGGRIDIKIDWNTYKCEVFASNGTIENIFFDNYDTWRI
ncbi:inositol monophosphatase family protein [Pseudobacteriovorax antillogorgiicola]|uniref:inositol monophosphatase family protein n=1 Tax=Pseudobacteriovorax antillogorgiicola TaxID=1513793 RepID=UPI00135659D8|nr:inositol monophosphatase family protein [Pseudobacteriovorax antillogorgiicola]